MIVQWVAANLGFIPYRHLICSSEFHQQWSLITEPRVSSEHRHVWGKKIKTKQQNKINNKENKTHVVYMTFGGKRKDSNWAYLHHNDTVFNYSIIPLYIMNHWIQIWLIFLRGFFFFFWVYRDKRKEASFEGLFWALNSVFSFHWWLCFTYCGYTKLKS